MVSFVFDWRFARHVDFYAGIGWEQRFGGLLNTNILATNNLFGAANTAANGGCATGTAPCSLNTHGSTFTPAAGLRYQF